MCKTLDKEHKMKLYNLVVKRIVSLLSNIGYSFVCFAVKQTYVDKKRKCVFGAIVKNDEDDYTAFTRFFTTMSYKHSIELDKKRQAYEYTKMSVDNVVDVLLKHIGNHDLIIFPDEISSKVLHKNESLESLLIESDLSIS